MHGNPGVFENAAKRNFLLEVFLIGYFGPLFVVASLGWLAFQITCLQSCPCPGVPYPASPCPAIICDAWPYPANPHQADASRLSFVLAMYSASGQARPERPRTTAPEA